MSQPGGNVTGLFLDLTGMSAKWLQLLKDAVPTVLDVGLLWDNTTGTAQLEATRDAAIQLGLRVHNVPIANWANFDTTVTSALRRRFGAFVVLSSPTAFQYSGRIAEFARENRMPAISPFRPFALAGGLMSYGPDLDVFFRRVAYMIDRLLKGTPVTELSAEQPTAYQLVVNMRAAQQLGLAIPQRLMLPADEVVS